MSVDNKESNEVIIFYLTLVQLNASWYLKHLGTIFYKTFCHVSYCNKTKLIVFIFNTRLLSLKCSYLEQ